MDVAVTSVAMAALVADGLLAGLSLDKVIVQLPARRGRTHVPQPERRPDPAVHLLAGLGKTRALALTPDIRATPLMRRPYDLRHSGITWRLNSGVPPTEIAAWAGHSVETLLRIYARCVAGMEDVWIARMDATLRSAVQQDGEHEEGE